MIDAVPTPAERLGVLVKSTQAVLHQRMDEVLRPLGLSVSQYACLNALQDSPGITGSELARRTFVSRQSMNVLLQGLEKQGLIARAEEPGPRRERATDLTPAAEALLDRARVAVGTIADRMAAPLAPAQVAELTELLAACRDALLAVD
ncbi:MarR family winged helix-turn-helix transcriptional regulator [Curtobacterium sp. ISL-83]|uniref:MarR family winged helix-turn-helix transcriptional regulator n=1 Tax=Curtobacterium sp. ISL-83 TaxID=2819145 RepID=UPI001BE55FB9|nr:MarR family transcriptional regulator [Curtobacterium sp. ISL-83]MBT2502416.1 MarR family transcriptional regulator [Curtobacterium sp. ISL-83]